MSILGRLHIALDALERNVLRSFLTMLGIIIGSVDYSYIACLDHFCIRVLP